MNNNKELVTALAGLLTAVTFKSETVNLNGEDCYEARVPVGFIVDARSALHDASKTPLPEGVVKVGYFEKSPQGGLQYTSSISQTHTDIRKPADYLSKRGLCAFEYAEELLDGHFANQKSQGTSTTQSSFNSAAETRECMRKYAEIRKREMNDVLEKLCHKVNTLTTEAAMMGNKGVSITYADHLSIFFPEPKLEYVFTAMQKELVSIGYDVEVNLPCQIIHIRWNNC